MAYAGPMPNYPLKRCLEISASNATAYDPPLICVRVGSIAGGAVLEAKNIDGTAVTFDGCTAGEVIWGPFTYIMATGTTVSSIVGWTNEQ